MIFATEVSRRRVFQQGVVQPLNGYMEIPEARGVSVLTWPVNVLGRFYVEPSSYISRLTDNKLGR